jgi:integrase
LVRPLRDEFEDAPFLGCQRRGFLRFPGAAGADVVEHPLVRASSGKDGEDLVFTAPGGGVLRINNWRPRVFDRACKAAGVAGVSPHDLRHTAASLAISAGGNVTAVQRMPGNASAAMTLDVYAGLFTDDLDDVADRLKARVPQMCPDVQDDLVEDEVPGHGSCL